MKKKALPCLINTCMNSQLEGYLDGSIPLTNGKLIKVVTENSKTTFTEA